MSADGFHRVPVRAAFGPSRHFGAYVASCVSLNSVGWRCVTSGSPQGPLLSTGSWAHDHPAGVKILRIQNGRIVERWGPAGRTLPAPPTRHHPPIPQRVGHPAASAPRQV